jgi:hypothetical protein
MSFIILVFKMLHTKPSAKILNISVKKFEVEIQIFLFSYKYGISN